MIRDRLGMRKVSARWVSHHYRSTKSKRRLTVATNSVSRFETKQNIFNSKLFLLPRLSLDQIKLNGETGHRFAHADISWAGKVLAPTRESKDVHDIRL